MPTVTYKGPADGNAVRVRGTRFPPGKPVEVDDDVADAVLELEGYEFEVTGNGTEPPESVPEEVPEEATSKSKRSKAAR